ncbi:MAG: cysteine desulfurase family protein [Planctomycetota bacterium]|nr:cysteine desulfurase family protein [Planctomycetota bacterium]
MTPIYLDNNATTRPFPQVVEAMSEHFSAHYANPGSRHQHGRKARQALEDARETIARILGASPKEVVFTSGGTESSNLAIFGFTRGEPGTIVLTAGEHPATVESCESLASSGWSTQHLNVDADGRMLLDQYDDLPWDRVKLVTLILAHNETGVIQDIGPLAKQCRRHGVPLHLDAVQAVGKIPVHFRELGVSTLALGAHKFHGPRGIGALLLREDCRLAPYLFGGHQEAGRRPGTEPVALIVGMAKALEIWDADQNARRQTILALRDRLEAGLLEACDPAIVNGSPEHRLPNTLNIAFPGADGEALLVALDLVGVSCSLGSTCASGSADPAPVLVAMGREPEVYKSSVRFSVGIENSPEEIDDAIRRITNVVRRLRGTSSHTKGA